MERELWLALYRCARKCGTSAHWELVRFFDYEIVGVFLWAVLHDRPVSWACKEWNWPKQLWHRELPSQSTMSRRLRTAEVQGLLHHMEQQLRAHDRSGFMLMIDGKPLVVGVHSKDRDATWGRAGRGYSRGYKLHAIYGSGPIPVDWELAPMNVSEPDVAARLILHLEQGSGYILGDKAFDSNRLHDNACIRGYQLVAERKRPGTGLGHCRHSPGRLRSIALLQTDFGRALYHQRDGIERQFGWLTNHATGLMPLPSWIRRPHRVRLWVQAKLTIHAMYAGSNHPRHTTAIA
jgi:hypothetical protein